jgi:glycosyltransferase involved in cell wall biosynthesis
MKIFIDCGHDHILVERMNPYFKKFGASISNLLSGCDAHLSFVNFITPSNLPKILRLDGIYYDIATDYKSRNSCINNSCAIANGIIYQSEFSKNWSYKYLSKSSPALSEIIYNGVQPDWCGPHIESDTFNILLVSNWRRWKRLKEMIEVFLEFRSQSHFKTHLYIIGKPDFTINDKGITYYGKLHHTDYKKIFSVSDVSMHLAKRDWCPNSLIETIGAGIPVITTDSEGGAKELVSKVDNSLVAGGDILDNELLYQYSDSYNVLSDTVRSNIIDILNRIANNRLRVKIPEIFNIEHVAQEYIKFIYDVCERMNK